MLVLHSIHMGVDSVAATLSHQMSRPVKYSTVKCIRAKHASKLHTKQINIEHKPYMYICLCRSTSWGFVICLNALNLNSRFYIFSVSAVAHASDYWPKTFYYVYIVVTYIFIPLRLKRNVSRKIINYILHLGNKLNINFQCMST